MRRQPVETPQAPKAIGPYAQAIRADGIVYTSGQIGIDPATGALVPGGIEAQTRRVLENLKAVLAAAGSSLDRVLRVGVYLTDLGHFQAMNRIFAEYLDRHRPARSTVGVAALPMGALVEMDMIALCD
ncbi:MAG: RidA family protein [candidate division NC10 bacterium]|jgi:reactive intermediate/imine deaminase|nr:RidA family protein [candidate division NC10 bacterium]